MIGRPKLLVAIALALGGAGLFGELQVIARQKLQLNSLRQHSAALARQLEHASNAALKESEITQAHPVAVAANPAPVPGSLNEPFTPDPAATSWLERVRLLKALLEASPEQKIPELALMTDADWLESARRARVFISFPLPDHDFVAETFSQLRETAKGRFADNASRAIKSFALSNRGLLPTQLSELAPYFEPAIDPAILQRYEIVRTGKLADLARYTPIIVEKSLVDERHDRTLQIAAGGIRRWLPSAEQLNDYIDEATQAFREANPGQAPSDPAQLMPHLPKFEIDLPTLQKFWISPLRRGPKSETPPTP